METELSANIKKVVIEQELVQIRTEMYRLALRHAVQEKLGKKQNCEIIEGDMENVQAAILIYEEELEKVLAKEQEAING